MLHKIENYYKNLGLNPFLIKKKLGKLEKHVDILNEFALWIDTQNFKTGDCVSVNGYTAEELAGMFGLLNGEAAFMLLVELRDEPEKAKARIAEGFHIL